MKQKKPPYTPTRTCPHRWCRMLHLAPAPFGLAFLAFEIWHNWIFLVTIAGSMLLGSVATKLVHFRPRPRSGPATIKDVVEDIRSSPSPLDLEMEDAKYEGTGWRMLEVRKGWARVAVGCDLFWLTAIGLFCGVTFTNPREGAQLAADYEISGATALGMLVGTSLIAFTMYAHKKATQPRKPKRVWVPAFLRTNI